jgi:hypothetical protein
MEPLSVIASAIVSGAAAALSETVGKAVKEAYSELKSLIQNRFASVDFGIIEKKPDDEKRRAVLESDLHDAHVVEAHDVLEKAKLLLDAIANEPPGNLATIGIDIKRLVADRDIIVDPRRAGASGIRGEEWRAGRDAVFRDVEAGSPPKNA